MENRVLARYEKEPGNTFFKLYWKTLRLNRQFGKWWHRGADVVAIVTTRCNLHCNQCPMFIFGEGKYPKFHECTLEEWKEYFQTYPEHIGQVYITGGEPSILPWISDLINWLVDRGHHVLLFTNLLTPKNLLGIKKHWRFVCVPTYHKTDSMKRYDTAYQALRGRFRMVPQEFGEKVFPYSRTKELFSKEWFLTFNTKYHFVPDTPKTKRIFNGCTFAYGAGFPKLQYTDGWVENEKDLPQTPKA